MCLLKEGCERGRTHVLHVLVVRQLTTRPEVGGEGCVEERTESMKPLRKAPRGERISGPTVVQIPDLDP